MREAQSKINQDESKWTGTGLDPREEPAQYQDPMAKRSKKSTPLFPKTSTTRAFDLQGNVIDNIPNEQE